MAAGDDFPGRYGIVGRSVAMQRIFEQIAQSARSWANILLLGESGVGIPPDKSPSRRVQTTRPCTHHARMWRAAVPRVWSAIRKLILGSVDNFCPVFLLL